MADRVIVYFPPGYRELWDELQRYAKKERADRLRFLATYGLAALKGKTVEVVQSSAPTGIAEPPPEKSPLDMRRAAVRDRLKASLTSARG